MLHLRKRGRLAWQHQIRKYLYRGYGAVPSSVPHRIVLRILGDSINENRRLKLIYAETVRTVSLLAIVCDIFIAPVIVFPVCIFTAFCLR